MVSLYDSFMFPSAHHHAAAAHHAAGVVGGMAQGGQGGHPHHPMVLARQPVPPAGASSNNVHHAPQPHPHHHHHHQMAPNGQYFGYSHAHHWAGGPNAGAQGHHAAAAAAAAAAIQYPNAMMVEHQQQFVSGLVSADGTSSWHPTPYAAAAGLASVSPRTPAYDHEWTDNSPHNNNNNNNATSGGVSSPDTSPFGQASTNGPSSPDHQQQQQQQQHINYPYGKLFTATGEFLSPHNLHQQQADVQQRMNASGAVVPGHHSPDSGLAGSDGLSSAGSPAQQQQQGMLGSSTANLLAIQQQQQQQAQQAQQQQQHQQTAPNGPMTPQHGQQLAAAAAAGGMISRPQPSRSPFEWMKKPAYQSNPNPVFDGLSAGKTRTKDKYRVVYTDNQRLELEKEFHYSRYITIRRKSELANVLGLSERQVKIWFQNRRAKERKQVKKREELLHKDKIEVVPSLGAVQQQQQQQQQLHAGHMQHMNPQHLSAPQISSAMQQHIQMDAKASLGLD